MNIEALLTKVKPHKFYWFDGDQINSATYGAYYTIIIFVLLQYTGGFEDFMNGAKSPHSWGFIIDYNKFKSIINNCKINLKTILDEDSLIEPVTKLCDIMSNLNTNFIAFNFYGELIDVSNNKIEYVQCACALCKEHNNQSGENEGIIAGELKCISF